MFYLGEQSLALWASKNFEGSHDARRIEIIDQGSQSFSQMQTNVLKNIAFHQVLPHVEPPATPPVQQRVPPRSRDDAKQAVRSRARHPHQLVLLRVSAPLGGVPSA